MASLPGAAFGQGVGTAADPQYLMFQLFTAGPGFTTEPDSHIIDALPSPDMLPSQTREILDAVGTRGDAGHRLGVMIGPLVLDYTDAQMRTLIERTFAIAIDEHVAVGLHIDDSKFWMKRRDLWSDPANVEWLDWQGTPNGGQYLDWGGGPWRLAPQACFNSPAMLKEARRVAGMVIGPAIAAGLAKLRKTGDEALFAGVIVGWETAIGRDYATRRDLGYCALTNLGFSEHAPPPDADAALEGVVQGWIAAWSDALVGAGVPASRIYSHIAFKSKRQFDSERGGGSYPRAVMYTPPSVAFGGNHRPAFTTYPEAGVFTEIDAELAARGHPAWGSAEGANVDMQSGPPAISPSGMQSYLAHMFNHGASLVNIFGWHIGTDNPFRKSTEQAEAIAAYRDFLHGARLVELPVMLARPQLQDRMHALPDRIGAYRCAGGDVAVIQPRLQRLQSAMREGRLDAMTQELDGITELIDARPLPPACARPVSFDIGVLQQQLHALPQLIDAFQQHGGDIARVRPRVESIQQHVGSGELERAYAELQALEPILKSP